MQRRTLAAGLLASFACARAAQAAPNVLTLRAKPGAPAAPFVWRPARKGDRRLDLRHAHTGERLDLLWTEGDRVIAEAKGELDHFMRDWRTGEVLPIDTGVLFQLNRVADALGKPARFELVSGYRSEQTNEVLRRQGLGVARNSFHVRGRALDIRPIGVALRDFHRAALAMRAGGVGVYSRAGFVHLDSGRARRWGS